jgi:hypothetical protein
MILKVEGSLPEVVEFLDRINRPRIIPFPVPVNAGGCTTQSAASTDSIAPKRDDTDVHGPEKADTPAPDIEKEKAPADKKPSVEASRPTPKKQPGRKPSRPEITLQDIQKEVDLNGCYLIPEALEAILQNAGISGAHLGRLLGIDKSAFSKARNGVVGPLVKSAFKQHLQFSELAGASASDTKKPKTDASAPAIKKVKKADVTPEKKVGRMPAGKGSIISLERLLEVDLSDCDNIPEVINKLQLETNISGTRLAGLLEIHACDLSKARKGVTPPFIERAFKQHLQFPAVTDN